MPLPARVLDLPPRFRPLALRELHDAFDYCTTHAAALGAGALVFVGRFDVAEFAVVLEPEEPLASARGAFYAGMMALADTLAALAPPETSIAIAWPDAVHVGGRLVGGGRLAWPRGAAEHGTPDWLVFAASFGVGERGEERLPFNVDDAARRGVRRAWRGAVNLRFCAPIDGGPRPLA